MAFEKLKKAFKGRGEESDYIEIDLGKEVKKSKIIVRPFVLKTFAKSLFDRYETAQR